MRGILVLLDADCAVAQASVSVPNGFIKGLRRTRWRTSSLILGLVINILAAKFAIRGCEVISLEEFFIKSWEKVLKWSPERV
ncbi:hypothetical protein ES703_44216 [subsurface metagenome]